MVTQMLLKICVIAPKFQLSITKNVDLCVRSIYQGQGQVITSHINFGK